MSRRMVEARQPRLHPLALAALLALGGLEAAALPLGEQVRAGQVQVERGAPGQMLMRQQGGPGIVHWQSFSIAHGERVRIEQPGAASVLLNRVVGGDASAIFGALQANGRVFLVNPRGVLFGPTARVEAGSLVASTLDIRDDDFLSGRFRFAAGAGPGAAVVNQGRLVAAERGTVALLGGSVRNDGLIEARLGTAALAAGGQVSLDFAGDGLSRISVDQAALQAQVSNGGALVADGGAVLLTAAAVDALAGAAVNQTGVLRARTLVERDGRIVLDAGTDGTALAGGTLDATGAAGLRGGEVQVLGRHVAAVGAARLDASGDAGGGRVLVGGDAHGANPAVRNAEAAYVAPDATLRADATGQGAGGRVVVWGHEAARAHGTLSAQGGALGGDGGLVETSGRYLDTRLARVSASAPAGRPGQWLLDPADISITGGNGTDPTPGLIFGVGLDPVTFTSVADSSVVLVFDIQGSLNNGTSVTVSTGAPVFSEEFGNIVLQPGSPILKSAGGDATLRLNAHNHVVLNSDITSTAGRLNIELNSDADAAGGGAVRIGDANLPPVRLATNGGDLRIFGQGDPVAGRAGGDVSPFARGGLLSGVALLNASIDTTGAAGDGAVSIRGQGLPLDQGPDGNAITLLNTTLTTRAGSITLDGLGGNPGRGGAFTGPPTETTELPLGAGVLLLGSSLGTSSGAVSVVGVGANAAGSAGFRGGDGVVLQLLGPGLIGSQIRTDSGAITLDGLGGAGGAGTDGADGTTFLPSGALQVTPAGPGAPGGAGGAGLSFESAQIASGTGDIRLVAQGGAGGPGGRGGAGNLGGIVDTGQELPFTAGVGGAGGQAGAGANGIELISTAGATRITSGQGTVSLDGRGGAGGLGGSGGPGGDATPAEFFAGGAGGSGGAGGAGASGVRSLSGSGAGVSGAGVRITGQAGNAGGAGAGGAGGNAATAPGGAGGPQGFDLSSGVRLFGGLTVSAPGTLSITGIGGFGGAGGAGGPGAPVGLASAAGSGSEGLLMFDVDLSGGVINLTGLAPVAGAPTPAQGALAGVRLLGGTVQAGSAIDIRGLGGLAEGVSLDLGAVVRAGSGRITLTGDTAAAAAPGLQLGQAVVGGGEGDAAQTGDIVLRARNQAGADGIRLFTDEEGVVTSSIQTTGRVAALPGGLSADGTALEAADATPITLLGALGTGGFTLTAGDLAALDPGIGALVVGSNTHTGPITLGAALALPYALSLQNGGAGSAGINLNAGATVPSLMLSSGGLVTQTALAPIRTASLLLYGTQPQSGFLLASPDNQVGQVAARFDAAPGTGTSANGVSIVNAGALSLAPLAAPGFDTASGQPGAVDAARSVVGGNLFAQTLAGDLTLAQDVSTLAGDITLVSAGVFRNAGAFRLLPADGAAWRIWASTWTGEERGGLQPSSPVPNLYGCAFGVAPCAGVPAQGNHFVYAGQPQLTLTADDLTRIYGEPNPPLTVSAAGLLNGDTLADAAAVTLATGAETASPVGTYPITATALSSPAGYALSFQPGTLNIAPAPLEVRADPQVRLEGQPNPPLTVTVVNPATGNALSPDELKAAGLDLSTSATAQSPEGNYTIVVNPPGLANFTVTAVPATLKVVDPARLPTMAQELSNLSSDVYERNFGSPPICTANVSGVFAPMVSGADSLSVEWTRVRQKPRLANCTAINKQNGCDDF